MTLLQVRGLGVKPMPEPIPAQGIKVYLERGLYSRI